VNKGKFEVNCTFSTARSDQRTSARKGSNDKRKEKESGLYGENSEVGEGRRIPKGVPKERSDKGQRVLEIKVCLYSPPSSKPIGRIRNTEGAENFRDHRSSKGGSKGSSSGTFSKNEERLTIIANKGKSRDQKNKLSREVFDEAAQTRFSKGPQQF